MWVCVVCMHVNGGTHRGQKKASDSLQLESQATVSCLMCWKAHCKSFPHCEVPSFLSSPSPLCCFRQNLPKVSGERQNSKSRCLENITVLHRQPAHMVCKQAYTHFIWSHHPFGGGVISLILGIEELRLQRVRGAAQGHIVSKWWS